MYFTKYSLTMNSSVCSFLCRLFGDEFSVSIFLRVEFFVSTFRRVEFLVSTFRRVEF